MCIKCLGSPHCSRMNTASLGASFFVWVCLGVLRRRVCAGVTNGIYVCRCQGD